MHFTINIKLFTYAYSLIYFALLSNSLNNKDPFKSINVNLLYGFCSLESIITLRICFFVADGLRPNNTDDGLLFLLPLVV
jgi:hypothetical protein